jgi:hypothetical protein
MKRLVRVETYFNSPTLTNLLKHVKINRNIKLRTEEAIKINCKKEYFDLCFF